MGITHLLVDAELVRRPKLILHVFRHAAEIGFGGVDVAGGIDRDAFTHCAFGSIGYMRRNEGRYMAVFQTADADAAQPAGMNARLGFGIGDIDVVVVVDGNSAGTAEFLEFADVISGLGEDLDSMIVPVGDDQPPLRIQTRPCGVRNSPGPLPVLPMTRRNLPFLSNTEMRPTRLGPFTSEWLSAT